MSSISFAYLTDGRSDCTLWQSRWRARVAESGFNKRFMETTRGQIVALLRRGTRTVEELAQALGLTDNAVRGHLATLERDGLARPAGVRRGPGGGETRARVRAPPGRGTPFSPPHAP